MGRLLSLRGVTIGTDDMTGGLVADEVMSYHGTDTTKGWKVISATCLDFTSPMSGSADGLIIHTDSAYQSKFDLGDSRVIGFTGSYVNTKTIIDPNHVIVGSLYISQTDRFPTAYLIVLEEIKIDSTHNIIYRIKEKAQDFA